MKTIEEYEVEEKKIEAEIQDLWAVGKKSKTKENRLDEVRAIMHATTTEQQLKEYKKKARYYFHILKKYSLNYDKEGWKEWEGIES